MVAHACCTKKIVSVIFLKKKQKKNVSKTKTILILFQKHFGFVNVS